MREVFVTLNKKNNLWKIIDRSNNSLIEEVNDVLLFNAKYKRFNDVKGWHGTLSETINQSVIRLLTKPFVEISFKPKLYYPRTSLALSILDEPVKHTPFLRLTDSKMFKRGSDPIDEYALEMYCEEYQDDPD